MQQAGELLAHAVGRWASEDVEAVLLAERACGDVSTITLLDEVHQLRLQLGAQHMRVINAYAEGIKSFEAAQQNSRTT
jgi:hypothetical protein